MKLLILAILTLVFPIAVCCLIDYLVKKESVRRGITVENFSKDPFEE